MSQSTKNDCRANPSAISRSGAIGYDLTTVLFSIRSNRTEVMKGNTHVVLSVPSSLFCRINRSMGAFAPSRRASAQISTSLAIERGLTRYEAELDQCLQK